MSTTKIVSTPSDGIELASKPSRRPKTLTPKRYLVRIGTFMLAAPCGPMSFSALEDALQEGLREDPRVADLEFPEQDQHWATRTARYPTSFDPGREALLSGSDHFHNVQLPEPVMFMVRVPKKNQPDFMGFRDHPSDVYYVAWDGVTVVVAWEVDGDVDSVPMAGGQIVADVLGDCAARAGLKLVIQGCSPGCTKLFWHTSAYVKEVEDADDYRVVESPAPGGPIWIEAPMYQGQLAAVQIFLMWITSESFSFAGFKNLSRRLIDLDEASKSVVEELLELQYNRTHRLALPLRKRLLEWWRNRSETKNMKRLVTSLWLLASRRESLLGQWHEEHDEFRDLSAAHGTGVLFVRDLVRDERAVERQSLEFITRAVAETSNRFDARLIAVMTLVGALGGLVGALLGAAIA